MIVRDLREPFGFFSNKPFRSAALRDGTHRCPLHCVYCSNPLELTSRKEELVTADWLRLFGESAALGVLHLHFTGGEPLARPDLVELIEGARKSRLYTNLITSGIGLSRERLAQLVEAGLDHIQLSFQDSSEGPANWIAGARAHTHKIALAAWIRSHRIAFTTNLVVHRQNIDHLEEIIAALEALHPDRMEIAHAQYYGWALQNRIMEKHVIVAQPEQSIEQCMAVMTDKHIRHLPVVDGEKLIGIISIGDLVKSIIGDQQFTIGQLEHYIHGQRY